MLKKCLCLLVLPIQLAYANCDLSEFKWECDLGVRLKPEHRARSLVYCGKTFGYLTPEQYDILRRYQKADVNMVLTVNGDFFTAPCVPYHRG